MSDAIPNQLGEPESKADRFRRLFNTEYPEPQIGDFWRHEELERIFACKHKEMTSQMGGTIKKMLLRRGIQIECVPGKGYRANNPSQNVALTDKIDKSIENKVKQEATTLSVTPRDDLDETEKQRYDQAQRKTAMLLGVFKLKAMQPAVSPPKLTSSGQDGNAGER